MLEPIEYSFKTKPYQHQQKIFNKIKDLPNYALLMEQGTGKTKVIIDNFSYLYYKGILDGVLVIAPNGVHRNWVSDEIPKHMPTDIEMKSLYWNNSKIKTKKFTENFINLINFSGLSVLTANIESMRVKQSIELFKEFCKKRDVMIVVDESARIKNIKAIQTKDLIKLGKFAKYRRILTGTPITNSPFDLYSQFEFLDSDIIDHHSFYSFKSYFGVFENKMNWGAKKSYQELKSYRNLDELKDTIKPYSYRITKKECLDLPEKIYTKRYFDLTEKQRKQYENLKEDFILELENSEISIPMALTRLMKLQQISSNFFMHEDKLIEIDEINPRINLLCDIIQDISEKEKIIIWCRFHKDVEDIMKTLQELKISCVRYDGTVKNDDRQKNLEKFQLEDTRVFVANPATASEGLNLFMANNVIYYTNNFKLGERQQSEDRAHRIGQENNVIYYDLIANDTIDQKIIKSLTDKKELASMITGDSVKEWL